MAITNLTRSLVLAALLLVLVFGAFLFGWRTALISLLAILVSLVVALLVLYLRGATLNALVLAGLVIALGVVIDEAVVNVEFISKRLLQNRLEGSPDPAESVILQASVEMCSAVFFATLMILLAVLPVFFIQGISGALFQPLAVSYALAVLAAIGVAWIVTPVLSVILLAVTGRSTALPESRPSPLISWLQHGYGRILAPAVRRPWLAYSAVLILLVAGIAVLPFLRQDQLLPSFREPYLMVRLESAPATSHPEMNRIVARISSELRAIPGVQNVGAHVGRAVFGDQVVGINSAELWVNINPSADYPSTVAAVQETVSGYTGLDSQVGTYFQQTLSQAQAGASEDVTVRVFGEDNQVLRSEAEELRQALAEIDGLVGSHVTLPIEEPTLEIEVDLAAAQHYGVKPGDVRRAAATLLSGIQVGSLFEEQKVFDVVVWSAPEIRDSLSDVGELLIDTPGGGQVRLGDVATLRIVPSPTVIKREAVSPYLDVGFNVQGRDPRAVAGDVRATIQNFTFPLEYHAELMGDFAARQAGRQRMWIAWVIAAIGILLLLQATSQSWRLAWAAFLTLLASLSGGLLAAFLSGAAFTLSSLFALLAILGIAARNSLLLIKCYRSLERQGAAFSPDLVLEGSSERLAPIAMTALATGLSLLPFVLFGDVPGYEIVRPVAILILGGLFTSTLLNLFVIPALYLRFGASREADLELLPLPAGD
jgi:Cu/Ag efflux pump CusA